MGFSGAPFGPLGESNVDHRFACDREAVLSYCVSLSSIALLPRDEREALRTELRSLLVDTGYRLELIANIWRASRL